MAHPAAHGPTDTPRGFWAQTHHWLFDATHEHGYFSRIENGIGWLIIFSVLAVVAEHNSTLYSQYAVLFKWFDLVSVGIFTLEYLLRLGAAAHDPEYRGKPFARLRYMLSPYALVDLVAIAPFYFAAVIPLDVELLRVLRVLRLMRIFKLTRYVVPAWQEFRRLNEHRSLRGKLHALLEPTGHSGQLHTYVDNFIVFWVLVSIASVVLESVTSVHALFAREFHVVDMVSFWIFTLEYIARLYCAPEHPGFKKHWSPRWAYARSGQAVVDLLAVLPFLLEHVIATGLDLRFLRVFRLMRMLKLTRYTSATTTLYKVIQREWQVIFASVFVMMLLVVLTASMGYLFEHEAQPDKFENIPQSIYWAVVTLASVGYGDISPVTPMGRALTVVLALMGIGIFAIPAGLLASAFTDQLRIDRETFKQRLLHAYQGGKLDTRARDLLAAETERLHLSADDVHRLTEEAKATVAAQKEEERQKVRAVVIDPQSQPDLAMLQFRLLVSQLQLLQQATGHDTLARQIEPEQHDAEVLGRVLQALAASPATDSAPDPAAGAAGPSA